MPLCKRNDGTAALIKSIQLVWHFVGSSKWYLFCNVLVQKRRMTRKKVWKKTCKQKRKNKIQGSWRKNGKLSFSLLCLPIFPSLHRGNMASCPHVSSIRKQITCCNLSLLSLLSTSSALREWVCRKAKRGRLKRHEKRGRKSMKTCEEKGKRRGWDKGNVGKEKAREETELKTKAGGEKQGEKVNLIIFKDLWFLIFPHYFSKFLFLSSSLSLNPYFVLHLQHYPTYCIAPFLNFTYTVYICHSSHHFHFSITSWCFSSPPL